MFISLSDSYHNLACPNKVKQNLCTLMWSWNQCVHPVIHPKCASASLSDLPEYLGLKWDQFNSDICGISGV